MSTTDHSVTEETNDICYELYHPNYSSKPINKRNINLYKETILQLITINKIHGYELERLTQIQYEDIFETDNHVNKDNKENECDDDNQLSMRQLLIKYLKRALVKW